MLFTINLQYQIRQDLVINLIVEYISLKNKSTVIHFYKIYQTRYKDDFRGILVSFCRGLTHSETPIEPRLLLANWRRV